MVYSILCTRRYLSWIEGLTTNQNVGGSNPSRRTTESSEPRKGLFSYTETARIERGYTRGAQTNLAESWGFAALPSRATLDGSGRWRALRPEVPAGHFRPRGFESPRCPRTKKRPTAGALLMIWRRAGDSPRCLRQRSTAPGAGAPSARKCPPGTSALTGSNPRTAHAYEKGPVAGAQTNLAESWGFEPQIGLSPILA